MMLVDNLIHSDLHPGNIYVRLEPPAWLLGAAYRTLDIVRTRPSWAATAAQLGLPPVKVAAMQVHIGL